MSTANHSDFIVIGAGSAGCVLANRLSENPSTRVTLLEAGGVDHRWDWRLHMPAALAWPLKSRTYNWWYETLPEPAMNNRQMYCPRGKVLGGSSAINGMVTIRGNALDYEGWAKMPGLENWSYGHCLPYFRKSEKRLQGGDAYRGDQGPLQITTASCKNPLYGAFLEASQQAGFPFTDDVNGFRQEGVGPFDMTTYQGRRNSAARAYLDPVRGRPNLDIRTRAHVQRLCIKDSRVTAVEIKQGGTDGVLSASEVIVCAGAIGSPQLLQISGIGNPLELAALDIEVTNDLPGVGENLQDHLEIYVQTECLQAVSLYSALKPWNQLLIGARWLLQGKGIGASNQFEAGGFLRSEPSVDYPNLQYHFIPIAMNYDGSQAQKTHGYQLHVGPMRSDSRGYVKIRTGDANTPPNICFNYLSTEKDKREMLQAVQQSRNILSQAAFAPYRGVELAPGDDVQSDEAIIEFVRQHAESAYHPSCSCKMGEDSMAVTDGGTRVHGMDNLFVVDASIMPNIVTGNLNIPVIMIAEKAADRLLGNTPLSASTTPFYIASA